MADTPVFLSGLRGSSDFDATDATQRPKNFREAILWLDPNGMTPITALSAKMKSENTDDPEFNWYEELQDAKRALITNAAGAAGTSFDLSSTSVTNPAFQFKIGDLLLVLEQASGTEVGSWSSTTGAEIVRVTGVTDGDTITVSRNYANNRSGGSSGGVTVTASGHRVLLIGSAYEEGSTSPDGNTAMPTRNYNCTQIFKTPFSVTNTAKATNYRTGDAFENDRKRKMFNHAEALEQAVLWGIRNTTLTGSASKPLRIMGGLRYFLTSNVNASVGSISDDFFLDTLYPLFNYNAGGAGDQRAVFVGNSAMNSIQKAFRDSSPVRINYEGVLKFYGMKLQEFTIPQGTLLLKTHPLLNTDPVYSKSMFVLNLSGMIRRPLKGRDTKVQQNIQANDADQRKDQWLTELGYEFHFERTMGYYGNITY